MARKAKIGWWKTRSAYGIVIDGKQHILAVGQEDAPLGETYAAALTKYKQILELEQTGWAGDCNVVRAIFELYADHLSNNREHETLKSFKNIAVHFVSMYGELKCNELKRFHCTKFLDYLKTPRKTHKGTQSNQWSNTRLPLVHIKAAFNWAVEQEYIKVNPFRNIKNESSTARGDETIVTWEDFSKVLNHYKGDRRDILLFLWNTGCRPNEVFHLKAKYYSKEDKAIIYKWNNEKPDYIWKNAKKTKKDRVILLNDAMVKLIEEKIELRKDGYLFQNKRHSRFTNNGLGAMLRRMDKYGVEMTPYSIRHTYATNWIKEAGSIKVLADLLGTSVAMLEKHYSHTMVDKHRMRELLIKTMGNGDTLA
ncbi:MAG: hypothetical protein C0467_14050 [Planctomycetaceae bacterium]|nr:hypothetical protein [Planctomycetaceae bacterium]